MAHRSTTIAQWCGDCCRATKYLAWHAAHFNRCLRQQRAVNGFQSDLMTARRRKLDHRLAHTARRERSSTELQAYARCLRRIDAHQHRLARRRNVRVGCDHSTVGGRNDAWRRFCRRHADRCDVCGRCGARLRSRDKPLAARRFDCGREDDFTLYDTRQAHSVRGSADARASDRRFRARSARHR